MTVQLKRLKQFNQSQKTTKSSRRNIYDSNTKQNGTLHHPLHLRMRTKKDGYERYEHRVVTTY